MATTVGNVRPDSAALGRERAAAGRRFDWLAAGLSAGVIGGLYVDGWAHTHGMADTTFFTPWHALLYSSVAALGVLLQLTALRNLRRGLPWRDALPFGYWPSAVGVVLFFVGGVADVIWHEIFGIEIDVEALLSPSHLFLALSGGLMVTGPLRAAWSRPATGLGVRWASMGPLLVPLGCFMAILSFFTQFAHPVYSPWASAERRAPEVFGEIFTAQASGQAQTRLTVDPELDFRYPAWSPDGSRIVFSAGEKQRWQIFVMNADGSGRQQLTHGEAPSLHPAWSPDGQQIALAMGESWETQIYVMRADGSDLRQLTTEGSNYLPRWSPDGSRIVFNSTRDGNPNVYIMSAAGSDQLPLTTDGRSDLGGTWSPDSERIAFASDRAGAFQIYVMNADGTGQRQLTESEGGNQLPAWSPDGSRIAFTSFRDSDAEVYVMRTDGSGQVNVTNHPAGNEGTSFVDWAPDSRQIVYSSVGHPRHPGWLTQSMGIAAILLQSVLLLAPALLLVRRWQLPPGTLTVLFTTNIMLMTVFRDEYRFIPAGLAAGLVGDLLVARAKLPARRAGALRLFGFAVPTAFAASYFLLLQLTEGIGWTLHLWGGTILMAGIAGYLLTFLITPMPEGEAAA